MSPEGVVLAALRRGAYCDSVVLMQLQSALGELPEVLDAGVVMATPANRELLAAAGLASPEAEGATGEDLLVSVRARSAAAGAAALARVDALLSERPQATQAPGAGSYRPRTLAGAARQLPAARWALVSVPGRFAAGVARQALELGRHVFLYSDNVTLADEVELKRAARQRGLLVLGPDCGTAHLAGCGLGFANRVRRGTIGLVAASGTGLQAVSCRIHALGGGISQAIGTGGRDLSAAVGGATTLAALELLGRDPATEVLALLGKPPSPAVASRLFRAAAACGKPVVAYFFGAEPPAESGGLRLASHLEEVADLACAAAGLRVRAIASRSEEVNPSPTSGFLRGLFAGGTLAVEAQRQLAPRLGVIRSNVPLDPALLLVDPSRSAGHTVVDLGDDELTVGRLHPMIDPTLRLRRLRQEAADPATAVVLLDLVLGDGAEEDPAAALAPVIVETLATAANRELAVVVAMIGTEEDPQQLADQEARLQGAGARVHRGLAPALADCVRLLGAPKAAAAAPTQVLRFAQDDGGRDSAPAVDLADFTPPLVAWNVGLERFATSLSAQGGEVLPLDWRPPAGGDERLAGLLTRLAQRRDS